MSQFICPNCKYVYDEASGHPREGWPPGTAFADIEPEWTCPDCGVREQVDFVLVEQHERHDHDDRIIAARTRAANQGGKP
jgi:rubredoxin